MKNTNDEFFATVALFFIFFTWIFIGMWSLSKSNYKQGQIDAITGKVKYELRTNEDMTTSWEIKRR